MSGPDPTALESILPEVHDIFSERAAERDLAIIKKVKKIDTDTRQIVANREAEIKEVVRGENAQSSDCASMHRSDCQLTYVRTQWVDCTL
jgi:hypothetical protein